MQSIQRNIEASKAYICGGTPRDRYLKHLENISDLDFTTGDKSVQYLATEFGADLAKKYNVTVRTHDDGHSTIFIGSFKMDFSSNFNVPDIENILARKGIRNPTDLQKEMYSRDFSCNALLLSLDLKQLTDPTHQGFKDIKERMIRTCLDPVITLTTNKNRVVRAVYLSSKLDFDIDPTIIEYVKQNPESVNLSTERVMAEKLNEAFNRDPDRASYNISQMGLWQHIPITQVVQPYYMKASNQKVAYFQGGGGVNEPTPKKKKYKSETAITVQPRFKEPLYRNYDLYDVPGEHGPGPGWHSMQNYKSIQDFLKARRKKLKDKYKGDDTWQEDSGKRVKKKSSIEARASLLSRFIKIAGDENDGPNFDYGKGLYSNMDKYKSVEDFKEHADKGPGSFFADDNDIDFPNDEYIDPTLTAPDDNMPENGSDAGKGNQIGGYLDEYLPEDDFEGKPPSALNFGRDYVELDIPEKHLKELVEKYLSSEPTHGQYGLPDGVDLPDEDLGDPNDLNPDYGTLGPESLIYEDKWNI